jgi:hypothetical protein
MARAAQAKAFALLFTNGNFLAQSRSLLRPFKECRIISKTHCVRHFLAGAKENHILFSFLKKPL